MSSGNREHSGKSKRRASAWLIAVIAAVAAMLVVSAVVTACFSLDPVSSDAETTSAADTPETTVQTTTTTTAAKPQVSFNVGDHLFFGSYEQDGDAANGTEPIEWRVLNVEDDRILVISEYSLDCKLYHESVESVTWETCTLRAWLNDDFINAAFLEKERQGILEVELENKYNPKYYTEGCANTTDRIFFLSIDEANMYFNSDADRICYPTQYAMNNGSFQSDTNPYGGLWWLRTPGNGTFNAADVTEYGIISLHGIYAFNVKVSVRPAMYISLDSECLAA